MRRYIEVNKNRVRMLEERWEQEKDELYLHYMMKKPRTRKQTQLMKRIQNISPHIRDMILGRYTCSR